MSDTDPHAGKSSWDIAVEANERGGSFAAPAGSALTDAQKINKAVDLLQWMHDQCLVPDITAHDAFSTCRICRLIAELKAPNPKADDGCQAP